MALFLSQKSIANNIQISNITLTGQNTTSDFTMVQFDLTWENSWRISAGPSNWDAAWVFVKYRVGTGPWLHAFLNENGHITGTGTAANITPGLLNTANPFNTTTNPAMGAFVLRNGDGIGTFTQTNLKLRWNYGANSIADGQVVEIKVFAVEMVYVPQGSFYLGDASTSPVGNFEAGITGSPYQVTSEAAITLGGGGAGSLGNNNAVTMWTADDFNDATTQTLPAEFPKGFNAFYCMKYEITQGQYRDFLNTLTYNQQIKCTSIAPNSAAGTTVIGDLPNKLVISAPGTVITAAAVYACNFDGDGTYDETNDGQDKACFLGDQMIMSYLDWAALRPMTELEFEKACRGGQNAVANEYAWGTTSVVSAGYSLINAGQSNENISSNYSTTAGNALYASTAGTTGGSLRVGIFAANANNSSRISSGATYYGIMEMSGNLMELVMAVSPSTPRGYTGIHGNGELASDGLPNVSNWPSFGGKRGGGPHGWYGGGAGFMRVSDRKHAGVNAPSLYFQYGGRGIRSTQ